MKFVKSFLQGFLPRLYVLPTIMMLMSKIEGYVAWSKLERRAADKYYYFMLVYVFTVNHVTGVSVYVIMYLNDFWRTALNKVIGLNTQEIDI
ncbi:hypothetical protein RND81_09G085100 [Saponaria officinalis]|uniref:CSC1/OSCA1-like 7TM region domain-containing protein n=1 Tax=Saponaria officinalis TaxID=3572 RepID=A0AAW1IIP1_SAPOF